MTRRRAIALSCARYILPLVRQYSGLFAQPEYFWRYRDLADLRLSLEVYAAAADREWRRVGAG